MTSSPLTWLAEVCSMLLTPWVDRSHGLPSFRNILYRVIDDAPTTYHCIYLQRMHPRGSSLMEHDINLFSKGRLLTAESAAQEARLPGGSPERSRGRGASTSGETTEANCCWPKAACSLADVLHERGRLPAEEIRAVGAAAAAALARVHQADLVHGDVKPANLLLSRSGELLLADFDAAAPADGRGSPGPAPSVSPRCCGPTGNGYSRPRPSRWWSCRPARSSIPALCGAPGICADSGARPD